MNAWVEDNYGRRNAALTAAVAKMLYPVRHIACGKVHDASGVEVVGRYSDCTRWVCPRCKGICDDRPIGWGGNVERIKK